MQKLFIDSSYFIALQLRNEQNHQIALSHWQGLDRTQCFVTTSFIFDEVVTFFNSRGFHSLAVSWGDRLLQSQKLELIEVDEQLFLDGWNYFKRYNDKSFSLTDCVSFVVMKRFDLEIALTFDHHFLQAGFSKLP
jgi:predicted nucleic acid-binding protein